MTTFSITTLGCKVNQYDGEALAAELERRGFRRVEPAGRGPVALLVINTCCVTAAAMRKSRQALRRALRRWPQAAVLVAGCYGDYDRRGLDALLAGLGVPSERSAVVGPHGQLMAAIDRLAGWLLRPDRGGERCGEVLPEGNSSDARIAASPTSMRTRRLEAVKGGAAVELGPIARFAGHQRAFVKVQDGCDAFCAYCVVPLARPVLRWRPAEAVVEECRRLLAAGHREIVLCGIFLGAYGRATAVRRRWDGEPSALPGLLRAVAELEGLWRVRLSSLEPGDVTDELLAALAELPNAAPHLHLPLQSGSPSVLRRMNRQYTVEQYARAVQRVRAALDRPAITTDILVGFPGETEQDFAATLAAARAAGFAKIHAFPFSPMPGTAAWAWRGEAPACEVVRARLTELAELERQLAAAYRRQFVGQVLEGLVERPCPVAPPRRAGRTLRAMTDRYLPVRFAPPPRRGGLAGRDELTGRVVRLRIVGATRTGLAGELVE